MHLTHLLAFDDIGFSTRFICPLYWFEMPICFAATGLAPMEPLRCARCSTALRTFVGIWQCYENTFMSPIVNRTWVLEVDRILVCICFFCFGYILHLSYGHFDESCIVFRRYADILASGRQ